VFVGAEHAAVGLHGATDQ